MSKVYIGLGSNIGDKAANLTKAKIILSERVGDVLALSAFYETEPWGFDSDNSFLNAALLLESPLPPFEILTITQQIEKEMGRTVKSDGVYHDRIIDIDMLLYDDLIMKADTLTLPHPLMQDRAFVMKPLAEIAPNLVHPVFEKNMAELLEDLFSQE